MSRLAWYVHRWRAMSVAEMMAHGRKQWRQLRDGLRPPHWPAVALDPRVEFPKLPAPSLAPLVLREALQRDGAEILAGRWRIFGREVPVADPPQWQQDHFLGRDLATLKSAFRLNHRRLAGGADIRVIWELSRWAALVRLAQAVYVLGRPQAGETCRRWLANWLEQNPPFQGWNWTSALEAGLRLVQFCWIDALLTAARTRGTSTPSWDQIRQQLLPPHVYFVDRYRSFGSSANNHLLGELAGLIQAVIRWPGLSRWTRDIEGLQRSWEREVLRQFAEDGGNREQALNYHLFAWELCWQTRVALESAGRVVAPEVEERLGRAAAFYAAMQSAQEPWDYGDSDSTLVTPVFAEGAWAIQEWQRWLVSPDQSPALHYWLGDPPKGAGSAAWVQNRAGWQIFVKSGLAVNRREDWFLRWDLSPLGYLATAAHGHLDALHLSVWHGGLAWIIDPGTGAYYHDPTLRNYLASWEAHNGPHLAGEKFPPRQGPFLWAAQHEVPGWHEAGSGLTAELPGPRGIFERTVTPLDPMVGWRIEDAFRPTAGQDETFFRVGWQFSPACEIQPLAHRRWRLCRGGRTLEIQVSDTWEPVELVTPAPGDQGGGARARRGTCSPQFRVEQVGPRLELAAMAKKACVFRTTILLSARA